MRSAWLACMPWLLGGCAIQTGMHIGAAHEQQQGWAMTWNGGVSAATVLPRSHGPHLGASIEGYSQHHVGASILSVLQAGWGAPPDATAWSRGWQAYLEYVRSAGWNPSIDTQGAGVVFALPVALDEDHNVYERNRINRFVSTRPAIVPSIRYRALWVDGPRRVPDHALVHDFSLGLAVRFQLSTDL